MKYAPAEPPASNAITMATTVRRRPQRFFGRTTCVVSSSAARTASVSASNTIGPVSSPPIVMGAVTGSVGSIIAIGVGPVGASTFGVVRIKIGSFGATFGTGSTPERSTAGSASFGVVESVSMSSNIPPPTMSMGVGRAIFSAACTSDWPISRGEKRSFDSGRPARSRTCASAPKSALTGNNLPARLAKAAATVSAVNGTSPVIASMRMSASE